MRKAIITLLCIISAVAITGCSTVFKPYRPPVQQGNVLGDNVSTQLKPGMTKNEVMDVCGGPPVINNPFDQDTWTYVYTYQPSKGKSQEKQLTIRFKNDKATDFTVDLPPPAANSKK